MTLIFVASQPLACTARRQELQILSSIHVLVWNSHQSHKKVTGSASLSMGTGNTHLHGQRTTQVSRVRVWFGGIFLGALFHALFSNLDHPVNAFIDATAHHAFGFTGRCKLTTNIRNRWSSSAIGKVCRLTGDSWRGKAHAAAVPIEWQALNGWRWGQSNSTAVYTKWAAERLLMILLLAAQAEHSLIS